MSYAVDWADDPISALAAIWVVAADRGTVRDAQAAIDRLLAADPAGNGTPVREGLYAIEVPPLRALFEFSVEQRSVKVVFLRRLP
jgi:hypothetical protein